MMFLCVLFFVRSPFLFCYEVYAGYFDVLKIRSLMEILSV